MRAEERRFAREPGLRTRPLPDLGCLLVFTPERPGMHWLNASAWLLFELCEDASEDEIVAEYATAWPPTELRGLREELRAGLEELVQRGIVRAAPSSDPSTNQKGDRP
jgi:hypothetical protein